VGAVQQSLGQPLVGAQGAGNSEADIRKLLLRLRDLLGQRCRDKVAGHEKERQHYNVGGPCRSAFRDCLREGRLRVVHVADFYQCVLAPRAQAGGMGVQRFARAAQQRAVRKQNKGFHRHTTFF